MKKRILVVDDEASLTRIVKANLERTGRFEVRTENSGSNALTAAREFQPDLILLDVMMPDVSGDEIAAQLQEDPVLRKTKFVFVTAIVTKDEAQPGTSEIGGHTFLAKPFQMEELLATIDRFLGS